ncbi:MAG: NINE protein [Dehalococcoidia bacterium]
MQQRYNCPQCGQYAQYGQPQCHACGYQMYWQLPEQTAFNPQQSQRYNCPQCGQYVQYGQPQCHYCGYQMYWQPIQQPIQESTVQQSQQFNPQQSDIYKSQYRRHKKSTMTAYLLWLFLGWHYAYLGKWGTQFLYWITLGGLFIWVIADLFRIPGMVHSYNEDQSVDAMLKAKVLGQ